jgi:hypothetical protein
MSMRKEHQWLLLESSGELSRLNRWRLKRALQKDSRLQRYADEIQQLARLERDAAPEPPAFNTTQIEYQARREQRHSSRGDFLTLWQPALAYGAIAIALGMSVVYLSRNWENATPSLAQQDLEEGVLDWEDPYLDALQELSLELAGVGEDNEYAQTGDEWITEELDALARELLELGESS